MLLLIGALVLGVVVGLAFGGSFRKLSELSFRWWWLALLGLALQFVPAKSHTWAVGLLIASYVVLTVFMVVNIRMPGMWLLALGFVVNIVVIAANGGMPVSDHALRVAYGTSGYAEQRRELVTGEGGSKHHLKRPDDVLVPLTDVIPVGAPVHLIFSIGDLLSLFGAVWVVAAATLGHPATRQRRTAGVDAPSPHDGT